MALTIAAGSNESVATENFLCLLGVFFSSFFFAILQRDDNLHCEDTRTINRAEKKDSSVANVLLLSRWFKTN